MAKNLFASAIEQNETFSFFRGLGKYKLDRPDYGVIAGGLIGHIKSHLDQTPEAIECTIDSLVSYINNSGINPEDFRFVLANVRSFSNFQNKGFASFSWFNDSNAIYSELCSYFSRVQVGGFTEAHCQHLDHFISLFAELDNQKYLKALESFRANASIV